jgi:hypothetical protein
MIRAEAENVEGIRRFVQEYLVPGIRVMLREELGKIAGMEQRVADLELGMKAMEVVVKRSMDERGEKIGRELIAAIMGEGEKHD